MSDPKGLTFLSTPYTMTALFLACLKKQLGVTVELVRMHDFNIERFLFNFERS